MNPNITKQIIEDKLNDMPDSVIGDKHDVNLKFIEKVITEHTGVNISNPYLKKTKSKILSPKNFELEKNTVWSFKSRGSWATHNGNYRGNWSPYIPRNIILRYSNEGDTVLDYFCGAGTTAIECKLLNRNFIGVDINSSAIELTKLNLDFENDSSLLLKPDISAFVGDARNLMIDKNSVDLICAHPPYSNIINYTAGHPGDLSNLDIKKFLDEMDKVAKESFRVLKDDKYCAILIGDMRKNKNVVPLGFWVAEKFLNNGFCLEEMIIKRQHNCKTTGFWYKNSIKYNFLLLAQEYLIVFKKDSNAAKNNFNINENILVGDKQLRVPKTIKKDICLEVKTVWIFNRNNWLKDAISNLVQIYSNNSYTIFNNSFSPDKKKKYNLIILPEKNYTENDLINLSNCLNEKGLLAIFCQDRRLANGILDSSPIRIEKLLRNEDSLKIKEIIVVALNNEMDKNKKNFESNKYLDINHKYILLYSKN